MNCKLDWSYQQYLPLNAEKNQIYIDRVVPGPDSLTLDFQAGKSAPFDVFYREKGSDGPWNHICTDRSCVSVGNLKNGTEYEFQICSGDLKSPVGYARTGNVFGTVVNYLHPEDMKYGFSGNHLCSPSILKHPDGYLLASMDVFGRAAPQNLTLLFRSDDGGKNWYHYSELFPCFWGKLFMNRGTVYMLSTSTEYGDLLIGKSDDGGKTWGAPTVLWRGSCHSKIAGCHKGAMPVIEHKGRIWTGIDFGSWCSGGHANTLLSAPADCDLLDAANWSFGQPLPYHPQWDGAVLGDTRGCLEGNAVILPDGEIANLPRYTTDKGTPRYGLIPILRGNSDQPDQQLKFEKFIPFPGNLSKFDILFDPVSGYYYSIVNRIYDPEKPGARNLLSLIRSEKLEQWELLLDVVDARDQDPAMVGYQYVSFMFDGEDLIFLSRTAANGAASFHDNNYITFHRIRKFRELSPTRKKR